MTRVLITCGHLQRHFGQFRSEIEAFGIEAVVPQLEGQQFDAHQMCEHIRGCVAVVAGDDVIDGSVLQVGHASGLKAVIKWGIGTDSIDKDMAARLGIPVYNTPGVFSDEVADLALSHLLLLTRQLHKMHGSVREGGWRQIEGRSLRGMTAGVIGLGSIGLGIVQRCNSFGMRLIGYDVRELSENEQRRAGVTQVALEELLDQSDVVVLACNLTADNRHLMNADTFARMQPGSYLINVGRGSLIDEQALIAALEEGRLAGAGLDVFETEPLPTGSRLRTFENCILSTHCGSNTAEAVARVNRMTVDILLDVLGCRPSPKIN